MLLGYDGKQWIERRTKNAFFLEFFGFSRSYFQLGDEVAFLDTSGCHVLRGDKWIYRDFPEHKHVSVTEGSAWLDPDGKGLAVLATTDGTPGSGITATGLGRTLLGRIDLPWQTHRGLLIVSIWSAIAFRRRSARRFFAMGGSRRNRPLRKSTLTARSATGSAKSIKLGPYRISLNSEMASDCDARSLHIAKKLIKARGNSGRAYWFTNGRKRPTTSLCPRSCRRKSGISRSQGPGGRRQTRWQTSLLLDMETLKEIDHLPAAGYKVIAATDDEAFMRTVAARFG